MSDTHESLGISERESFENGYFYFVEAVETLSQPTDAQLQRMGYCPYNLAWELVCDVRAWGGKGVGSDFPAHGGELVYLVRPSRRA